MDEEGKFYVAEKAVLIFLWKIFNSHQRPWILQQLPTNSEGPWQGSWWVIGGVFLGESRNILQECGCPIELQLSVPDPTRGISGL